MKLTMTLKKFSLMNPDEVDKIEQLQQDQFRPNSFKQAKETAKKYLSLLKSNGKLKNEEAAMQTRLINLIRGNAAFAGYTEQEYLEDLFVDDSPSRRIAISRLMKDTNKGIADIDDQVSFPFQDGSKPTEKLAKLRLINDFGMQSDQFMLLLDAGPDRLMLDEKNKKLIRAGDLDAKAKARSIDAISDLKHAVIIWCMKYKGGTAAVGGSGQKDQGTTEGAHMAKHIEDWYAAQSPLQHRGKPVFFANLVYGGQFNDPKRIVENEMTFKSDRDCYRSFNISLDRVKEVIDFFDGDTCQVDTALEILYNKYAYDIKYTGNAKTAEKARLLEWTTI
jgi:hypothetical protein